MAAGRDEGRLAEVADVSDNIATWAGDLTESEDCDELVADTLDEFGGLDCLVNSAGILPRGDAGETDDEVWRDVMTINLDIPFYLTRAAIPHLIESSGSVVNLSSYWSLIPGERAIAYNVSKAALNMLTKSIVRDYAGEGIRANNICPGGVDTPMLADGAEDAGMDTDEFLKMVAESSPNGRIATPEEVAELALFLAGESATQINGATISIDGGLSV